MESVKPLEKGKGSLKSRVLRLLGSNKGFSPHLFTREEKRPGVSEYHTSFDFTEELRSAIVEAEQYKAMGTAEFQKRRYNR